MISKLYLQISNNSANISNLAEIINKNSIDINEKIADGNTLLHAICCTKNVELLNIILKISDINCNIKNDNNITPFHECCTSGFYIGCQLLLNKKVDFNFQDNAGNTPLHYAIYNNKINIIELLLKYKPNLYLKNKNNKMVLNEIIKYFPKIASNIFDLKSELICMIPSKLKYKMITHDKINVDEDNNVVYFKSDKSKNKILPIIYNKNKNKNKISKRRAYIKKYNYTQDSEKTLHKIIKYKNLNLISHEWVQHIINYYWNNIANKIFIIQLVGYLIYISLFTISSILFKYKVSSESYINQKNNYIINNQSIPFGYYYSTSDNISYICLDSFIVFINIMYSINEIYEICKIKKVKKYFTNIWNVYDIIQNLAVFFLIPLRLLNLNCEETILSFLSLIFWIKIFNFSRGFKKLGPLIKIIFKMTHDIYYFLGVYVVSMLGFCHSMFLLLGIKNIDYTNPLRTLITLFNMNIGDFDYSTIINSNNFVPATIVFMIFNILSVIILLNILVAILTDSYTEISAQAEKEWKLERANLTLYLMDSMCSKCFKKNIIIDDIDHLYVIINSNDDNIDDTKSLPYYDLV